MAPIATLYTYPALKKGLMIGAAGAQAGLEIEVALFELGVTNKSAEFLSKFPLGKVPALECVDGFKIYESASIARYLASIVPDSQIIDVSWGAFPGGHYIHIFITARAPNRDIIAVPWVLIHLKWCVGVDPRATGAQLGLKLGDIS